MLTSHKGDLAEAAIPKFQGRGLVPVHQPGDEPIHALVPICPQASEVTTSTLQPTSAELAVAEEDVGRRMHPYESVGSETHQPVSNAFWTSKSKNKIRGSAWKIRYEDTSNKRAYTPDIRQQASAAEKHRVLTIKEDWDENVAKLDAAYARWQLQCEQDPEGAPPFMILEPEEPRPLAAVAPPPKAARGRVDVGQA